MAYIVRVGEGYVQQQDDGFSVEPDLKDATKFATKNEALHASFLFPRDSEVISLNELSYDNIIYKPVVSRQ